MTEAIAADCTPAEAKELFAAWIENKDNADKTKELAEKIIPIIEAGKDKCNHCKQLVELEGLQTHAAVVVIGNLKNVVR